MWSGMGVDRMAQLLADIVKFALIGWLGLLALVIAMRILRGDIPLAGLLSTTGAGIDPERVQALLVIGFVFAGYLTAFATSTDPRSLRDVPESLLIVLAGSNGIYLSGKLARTVSR
jgi:hypothetical protein